jgi:hypothetical protein
MTDGRDLIAPTVSSSSARLFHPAPFPLPGGCDAGVDVCERLLPIRRRLLTCTRRRTGGSRAISPNPGAMPNGRDAKKDPNFVKEVHTYVGFANIPNQVHRKALKQGFDFTLMVVGEWLRWLVAGREEESTKISLDCSVGGKDLVCGR